MARGLRRQGHATCYQLGKYCTSDSRGNHRFLERNGANFIRIHAAIVRQATRMGLAIRAIDASERSYIDVMDQSGVGLPAMLVLKLPPANRALVRGILAAFDPQMLLERVAPHVLLAALETRPRPLRSGCKEKFTHYLDSSRHPPDSSAPRSAQKD